MDRQAVFDKAARHLLEQNEKSMKEITFGGPSMCLYRYWPDGDGGRCLKCAIGAFIPDDVYDQVMEGAVNKLVRHSILDQRPWVDEMRRVFELGDDVDSLWAISDEGFLEDLQKIHDSWTVDQWRAKLEDFAGRWGLGAEVLA